MNRNPVNSAITKLGGREFYYAFRAGAGKILENQIELNRINVFPVRDGDTGTNLSSTISAVVEKVRPDRSLKTTVNNIAEAALAAARGNSGIIFAQLLYGLSVETGDSTSLTLVEFAETMKRSAKYMFDAIANPVEGTMLTVINDWAEYIHINKEKIRDFAQLIIDSHQVILRSLEETTSKLAVLAKANVVDAGAKGFVLFIEGIIDLIKSKKIKRLLDSNIETIDVQNVLETAIEHVTQRFCTEATIRKSIVDNQSLRNILHEFGDSIVVAGSQKIAHFHIHTNTPADLFTRLRTFGAFSNQKAEDMVRQSEAAYRRKWKIALVTDSTCDLSNELMDYYQIHMLPINIHFGENHYLDKVTMTPKQFYALLDESPVFPSTSQVNESAFLNLYSQLASHYDSIIAVHLTGKFSGTVNNSRKAAERVSKEFNKQISVIDSKNVSGGLGLLTLRIARAIESGWTHSEILDASDQWLRNTKIFVSVRALTYMVHGGRVSHVKGLFARLLNITPIVSMDEEGKSILFGKTFSQRSNIKKVMEHIRMISAGKSIWNYVVLHADNERAAQWYTERMKALTGKAPVDTVNISPVIGMNAGIGAAAVSFMFEWGEYR
jgi:hypothetical protein